MVIKNEEQYCSDLGHILKHGNEKEEKKMAAEKHNYIHSHIHTQDKYLYYTSTAFVLLIVTMASSACGLYVNFLCPLSDA